MTVTKEFLDKGNSIVDSIDSLLDDAAKMRLRISLQRCRVAVDRLASLPTFTECTSGSLCQTCMEEDFNEELDYGTDPLFFGSVEPTEGNVATYWNGRALKSYGTSQQGDIGRLAGTRVLVEETANPNHTYHHYHEQYAADLEYAESLVEAVEERWGYDAVEAAHAQRMLEQEKESNT